MPASSYPESEETRTVGFRLMLTPTERAALQARSRAENVSAAQIIRQALAQDALTLSDQPDPNTKD